MNNLEGIATKQTPQHEITLFAEPIFSIQNFTITNSLLNTWLVVIFLMIMAFVLRTRLSWIPSRFQLFCELVIEHALALCDSITHTRSKSLQFFPIIFVLFLFILVNNWAGMLPIIGSIGILKYHEGTQSFIPLLRGGTADVNTTLALAIMSIIFIHVSGIIALGGWHYLNKFVNIKTLMEIPRRAWRNPSILLINPIKFFVGVIEIIGEGAKVASLSFRLFGNIFAGEVLLTSMLALSAFLVPIPFMFLELIVGMVQALVFSMLVLVFLHMATNIEEH